MSHTPPYNWETTGDFSANGLVPEAESDLLPEQCAVVATFAARIRNTIEHLEGWRLIELDKKAQVLREKWLDEGLNLDDSQVWYGVLQGAETLNIFTMRELYEIDVDLSESAQEAYLQGEAATMCVIAALAPAAVRRQFDF